MNKQKTYLKTFKLLFPFLWPNKRSDLRKRVSLALICLILAKVASVYTPLILGRSVDSLTELSSGINLLMLIPIALIISYGVARIASLTFEGMRDALFSKVSQHAIREVSLTIFKHLHSLSLQFHLNRQTGALSKFIDRGTKGIDFLLRYVIFNVVPTFIEIILVSIILLNLYGYFYALITIITITIYVILTFIITQWRVQFRRDMNSADNSVSTKMIDSLLNFETVKYFNNENHEFNRLDVSLKKYELAANKSRHSLSLLNIAQIIVIMSGITIMLVMTAFGIRSNDISIGGFVVINAYMLQLYQPLNFLGSVYREIQQSLVDMENMFNLLDEKSKVKDSLKQLKINSKTEIKFSNISFGYDERRTVIKDISFEVPNGKKVAIVGPTGAGKSTISRLLFRFYDPTNGSIYINDENINSISQHSLRKIIGVVPQDTVLFNDTIHYNISYGDPKASEDDIINAAKNADIHNFVISLPDGYETIVGERGLKLSGGEKQRVAIARTFLKNPKILFFDEATSALDNESEKRIQKALDEYTKDKITITIEHRLSTIEHADKILVMQKGAIVARGSHKELLNSSEVYQRLSGEFDK
jgi:ATP-binding cassette subfamily B protein